MTCCVKWVKVVSLCVVANVIEWTMIHSAPYCMVTLFQSLADIKHTEKFIQWKHIQTHFSPAWTKRGINQSTDTLDNQKKKMSLAQDTSTCDYPKRERSVSALIFVFKRDQTDRLAFRLKMPCLHQCLILDWSEITHFYLSFFVSFVSILTVRMHSGKRVKKKSDSAFVIWQLVWQVWNNTQDWFDSVLGGITKDSGPFGSLAS